MIGYIIDANVLISAKNQHYGFDFCPGFWHWLEAKKILRQVLSVASVYDELSNGTKVDELRVWAGRNRDFFYDPDSVVMSIYAEVVQHASDLQRASDVERGRFLSGADPFLIATAKATNSVVVTYEKPANDVNAKKIKIPDICKSFNVDCVQPVAMLRELEAKFILQP